MNEFQHKQKIGRFIFFSTLILFALILILYFLNGFTNEEFADIMKFFAPIKAVYMTALIKYVIAHRNETENDKTNNKINKLYKSLTTFMVYSHILSLIIITFIFALFRLMDYATYKNTITFIELFFGAYIGLIISDMFKIQENKEEEKTN